MKKLIYIIEVLLSMSTVKRIHSLAGDYYRGLLRSHSKRVLYDK